MIRNHPRELAILAKCLLTLAVVFTVACACMYYVPEHPQTARPASSDIYPKQLHGTTVYWNKTEVIVYRTLSILAVSFYIASFFIAWRLGLMSRPK